MNILSPFFAYCWIPVEKEISWDEDSFGQIQSNFDGEGLSLKISIDICVRSSIQPKNQCLSNVTSSQCIKEYVEPMVFNSQGVFLLPVAFGNNHMLSSFRFQQLSMLILSNNVQERNALRYTSLIQHSSKCWGSSSMDDSFLASSGLINFSHAHNSERVDYSWGSTVAGDVLVNDEALSRSWNCIFTPRSRSTLSERNSFSNPVLKTLSIGFHHSSCPFKSHRCWEGDWEIGSLNSHSIWRIYGRSFNLDQ